jgi:uncharacterized protein YjiS (DUF1127 family)
MDTGLMSTELTNKGLVTLAEREVLRFESASGRHVGVVRGNVWVTQHGDVRDHVLRAGESFRFDRDGLALVVALGGAAGVVLEEGLVVQPGAEGRALPTERRAIAARYDAWLAHEEHYEREARRLRARAFAELFAGLGRSLKVAWSGFARALSTTLLARSTGRELRALNDHLLRDIGVRRDQIDCIARRVPC